MSVKVKICGLTGPEDVEAVNAAGADYAGFVLFEKSRRFVRPGTAAELLRQLDPGIRSVAVCVSPGRELLGEIGALGFDVIQVHGELAPELLEEAQLPVWQAVNLSDRAQLGTILHHPRICGYVVDGAEYGGGKTFGWEQPPEGGGGEAGFPSAMEIREAVGDGLFILAGGLTPENVRTGIRLFSPDVVDVSSGVEKEGVCRGKDGEKIFRFIREVREHEE